MLRVFVLIVSLVVPLAGWADDWDALKSPTSIALMRHALAPGNGDPLAFEIDDCSTQRNLDSRGRAQSVAIGDSMRAKGVTFDAIWTSQWCRCRDTARLINMNNILEVPDLNSFFETRRNGPAQTKATMERLSQHQGGRLLLVTHQVNITALTGVFPQSGEIIVTELRGSQLVVTGRILMEP